MYFGIEPNLTMLSAGAEHLLRSRRLAAKRPRFSLNDRWDFGAFGAQRFDFVLSRSVWTHMSGTMIAQYLDAFVRAGLASPVAVATRESVVA